MPRDLVTIGGSWGGIEAVGRILSALPSGFPAAVAGSCIRGKPPRCSTLRRPAAPSGFAPVRTTPTRREPYASAAESSRTSIDGRLKCTGASVESAN